MAASRWGYALALGLSFVLTGPANAGNSVSAIQVRAYRNLTSVAVQAIVSGDDDSSAVLRIFQRWQGAAVFDTGMKLVRRTGTRIHEGRILWMHSPASVGFYVEANDGGVITKSPIQGTGVAELKPPATSGPVFYANQRLGNDAYDGTARSYTGNNHGPTRTIGRALQRLAAAPGGTSGGGVYVAPGEYHEQLVLPDGSGPRFLAGDGTDRDSTILCGANTWVEQGVWAPGRPLAWKLTQDSTYVTYFPGALAGSSPGDSTQQVVVGWGEVLHRKTSIRSVLNDSTWVSGVSSSTNAGELSGWYWQNDSLYVKRKNGQSPAGQVLHTGYRDELIDVRGRDWRISGLTLRYAGGTAIDKQYRADPDPGLKGMGISAGVNGWGSGLIVDGCRLYGLNACSISAVHSGSGFRADSVTVMNCVIDGLNVGRMAYAAGKGRAEEDVGAVRLLSRGANVHHNTFTGGQNGLQMGPGDIVAGARDSTWGSQAEIVDNTFTTIADDAIELDTSHCINVLVLGNTIEGAGHGVSMTPIYTGPVFLIDNTIADFVGGGIKVGAGSTGLVWAAHNTISSTVSGGAALDGASGGLAERMYFRNNILTAKAPGYVTIAGPKTGRTSTSSFDYNLLDGSGTRALANWNGVDYSLDALRASLGWERNGIAAAPSFTDPLSHDYAISPTSPAKARGLRISGVNTSLDGPLYLVAPDIGARSLTSLLDAPGPGPFVRDPVARALPNPTRGDGVIEYDLPVAARVVARLYDVTGRVTATLLDGVTQAAGTYRLPVRGDRLAPGIYLIDVDAGDTHFRGRLVLVR